ncbi:MAG: hypothetical protein OXU75_17980 [Deltaproteobacteria bacterium]|nr:hypothetical protein [Deltaproteobacteria bacterium]
MARRHPGAAVPVPLAAGLGLQYAGLVLPGVVLLPTIVFTAAGVSEAAMLWAVFASVVLCGAITMLQGCRIGRFGAGYVIVTGTSGPAIAVSIAALAAGGPALLAVLVLALALFQFAFSARLFLFRRILTPTVTGTVMMLTPVTVMPVIFEQLNSVPPASPTLAAPLSAVTTLAAVGCIVLKGGGTLRLWAPVIGIVAGSLVASAFGLYDVDGIVDASWIGFPQARWPGIDLDFGPAFWGLLPAFLLIALVCTIETMSGAVAIQRASWSKPRAVDFRAVQGAVAADATGNLLSALAGGVPLGFRPNGTAMVEITGLSSRHIGVAVGAALVLLACLPKALAVVLAIPSPVIAAFITIMMATIFAIGMNVVLQDGPDYRKGLIVGLSFWIGAGFEAGAVFPELASRLAGGVPPNGMIAGGLTAIVMTLLVELTKPRSGRMEVNFDISALNEIREFIGRFAARRGWDAAMTARLGAASEETLLTLLDQDEAAAEAERRRRLRLVARSEDGGAILEFVAPKGRENLQDRIALLGEVSAEDAIEREASLRLLRHLASTVRHQQYHDRGIVTVRVNPSGA